MTKVSGRVSCCRAAAADQISDHRIHALIGWRDSISRLSRGSQATRETRDAQEGVNDQTKWRCGRESRRRCLCTRRRQSKDLLDTCTAFQGWRPVRLLLSCLSPAQEEGRSNVYCRVCLQGFSLLFSSHAPRLLLCCACSRATRDSRQSLPSLSSLSLSLLSVSRRHIYS